MHQYDFDLADIRLEAKKLTDIIVRSPLLPYAISEGGPIRLKAENLQPTGSFKIRGSTFAINQLTPEELEKGVFTASAGNFGQGVALAAKKAGIKARVYVPENAAQIKIEALRSQGADVVIKSQSDWWRIMVDKRADGEEGTFLHPCSDPAVVMGNATIGVEIIEDWPDVDTILVPFGGGGLVLGIAIGAKLMKPNVRVIACESEAATPLFSAFEAGGPVEVPFDTSTFITGMGSSSVLPEMWPHLKQWVDDVRVVPVSQIAKAVYKLAFFNHIIAEGAGAVSLAAALERPKDLGRVAAVISGGNIDPSALKEILSATDAPT